MRYTPHFKPILTKGEGMSESYNIAVVGATGAVGDTILRVLEEEGFPVDQLYPLASERSVGEEVNFNGQSWTVQALDGFNFADVDMAFFSAGKKVSEAYVPQAAQTGCIVIDNTSAFRYIDDIPLVVPEVNGHVLKELKGQCIIANPNCSTIQLLVAIKPIHDMVPIRRMDVTTYQSVSGAGNGGIQELAAQTAQVLNGAGVEPEVFADQIAFNVIPLIDKLEDNGFSREEMKMLWETHKIMGDSSIQVNMTAVRVPVFYGHAEAVHLQLDGPMTASEAAEVLRHAPGVEVLEAGPTPTPVTHACDNNTVHVGRIRNGVHDDCSLNLWVVADNVRRGAAYNAVMIGKKTLELR